MDLGVLEAFLAKCHNLEKLEVAETGLTINQIVTQILPDCSKVTSLSFTMKDWPFSYVIIILQTYLLYFQQMYSAGRVGGVYDRFYIVSDYCIWSKWYATRAVFKTQVLYFRPFPTYHESQRLSRRDQHGAFSRTAPDDYVLVE